MNMLDEVTPYELRLRTEAEARLISVPPPSNSATHPAEKLLHELHVHQIELEMQNETLRQAQIALEESRDRYQDLYEFAPVGYLMLTSDGLISEINLTGAAFLGVERKKLLQKPFTAFVIPEEQARWTQYYLNVMGHDYVSSAMDIALRRGNGSVIHAQMNCVNRNEGGGKGVVRVTLTDVTQIKQAEREREHSLRCVESVMKHSTDCILLLNADASIIDVSDSCLEAYGYAREELLTMAMIELHAPDVHQEIPHIFQQLMERGAMSYQTWHRRKDGSGFPVHVGATMIDVDGSCYFQLIVHDVSENLRQRTIMEKGLAAATRRLHELSRHLVEAQEDAGRRLSAELHDRASPNLAAIQINLGMVAAALPHDASPEFTARLADTMALIEDTDASIREICGDLRSPVLDHAGLSAAMEGYAQRYASRTGIAVTVNCANSARLAPALESLLFRIFQEALTNSLKHARATSIKVVADLAARPAILTITDDGIGFDPDLVNTHSTQSMGLLSMRERAELAGGQIVIDSRPGAGTRIEVRIQP